MKKIYGLFADESSHDCDHQTLLLLSENKEMLEDLIEYLIWARKELQEKREKEIELYKTYLKETKYPPRLVSQDEDERYKEIRKFYDNGHKYVSKGMDDLGFSFLGDYKGPLGNFYIQELLLSC
jgi:predicted patatin/cPLA2 family phospholipase